MGEHFEIAPKTAQRSIDHFRDRLQAPFEYDQSRKGYYYTDPTFQLPVIRISEGELLALSDLPNDSSLVLTIPASHEQEIMMEILKHGSHVEVLEPEWLREKVLKELKGAAKNYQEQYSE